MVCRGVRGAITVKKNTPQAIVTATETLLRRLVEGNGISFQDVASIIFTTTPDLDAAFPAKAVRRMGLYDVALLCTQEMPVKGDLPRCIRLLVHWNTDKEPHEIVHLYLGEAQRLRPDRVVPGKRA
jgi:chorismate mutase